MSPNQILPVMKHPVRYYLLLAAMALMAFACKDPNQPEESITLSVSPTELAFEAHDTAIRLLTVKTNGIWSASTDAAWLHLDTTSGKENGSISVTADDTDEDRTTEINFVSQLSGKQEKATVSVSQRGSGKADIVPAPTAFDGIKRASTTYQLLIYSFADSNGDGIGDFKGIQNKLDYLDGLGVTALWLSPAHPTNSYHAYDVNDYMALNPRYGTEEDFKNLIDAAHAKGIKIYMDFVLNHSGTGHEWFKSVKADPANSPYKDYYVLSKNPTADGNAGKVDNYGGGKSIVMGAWHSLGDGDLGYKGRLHFKVEVSGGKPYKVTVTETNEAVTGSVSNPSVWIFADKEIPLKNTSGNIHEATADINTNWGFLVRTVSGNEWPDGTKFGAAAGSNVVTFGQPVSLTSNGQDIVFGETTYYMASFDGSMPDLNYGKYTECEKSPAFKATVDAATKWVNMGVDGFRLDAVIWIYQSQITANQRFLDQWYQAVNAAYKAAGHSDNIFMVGEAWEGHGTEKQYYKGLTSCFEFDFAYKLRDILKANGTGASSFASTVSGFITDHTAQRSDAITSMFLSNHDQNRFSSEIGKSVPKEKQAAAVLLTVPGKPFIYQGEELGYWGVKDGGDEYVRAPILWDKAGKDCAKKGVNNKVDNNMLKAENSVEAEEANADSMLNVYKTFSQLRNTYPALATGSMTPVNLTGVAAWKMSEGSQTLLVIHNMSNAEKNVTVSDSMEHPVALLGSASVLDDKLYLGAFSSIVFQL